jgi:hypothetical protein
MDTRRKFVYAISDELSALEPIFYRPELGTTSATFERMTHSKSDFSFTLSGVWQNGLDADVWAFI